MKLQHLIAAVLTASAMGAGAQTLKPGLWQVTNKMQTSGAPAVDMSQIQQQMANMPPEQRKMMEEMMAKQGVKIGPAAPGGGMSVQICMTREMVERNELPAQQGDCRTTRQSRSGNTLKFAMACTQPPSTSEGQLTYLSPEAYTMKMVIDSRATGKPEKVTMDGAGKWLGPDCGNVKPMAAPGK